MVKITVKGIISTFFENNLSLLFILVGNNHEQRAFI